MQTEDVIRAWYAIPANVRYRIRWIVDKQDWRKLRDPTGRYVNSPEDECSPRLLGQPVRFEEGAVLHWEQRAEAAQT